MKVPHGMRIRIGWLGLVLAAILSYLLVPLPAGAAAKADPAGPVQMKAELGWQGWGKRCGPNF